MKRILIIAAVVVGLVVVWLAGGRQLVLFVDAFATNGEAKATSGPFVSSGGFLSVGEAALELSASGGEPGAARIDADGSGRLTLHTDGKSFPLGARVGPSDGTEWLEVPFAPDPGDTVTFRVAHSVFPWPTPLELNFITGKSPSWKRNVCYTLTWRKRDGATLEMSWRYEQWFYDDWGSPQMTRAGATGLIDARIGGV